MKQDEIDEATSMSSISTPEGKNAFKLGLVSENLSDLMGKILTIIDASTEGAKNKALKDIIKQEFYNKQGWFSELAWKEVELDGEGHSPTQSWESKLVVVGNKLYSFKN